MKDINYKLQTDRFIVKIDGEEIPHVFKVKFKGEKIILKMNVIDSEVFNTIEFFFDDLEIGSEIGIELLNAEGDIVNTLEAVITDYKLDMNDLNSKKSNDLKLKVSLKTE